MPNLIHSNQLLYPLSGSFTGSLYGTSSWAVSASWAPSSTVDTGSLLTTSSFNSWTGSTTSQFAGTASYATTASYVQTAQTASYILQAVSASFAQTASYALTSSFAQNAQTASYVLQAVSSSYSSTASYATIAGNGGVTQLLAGPNVTLSPTNGLGQVTISSTSGGGGFNTATGSYGSFYSTQIQTNIAGTARSMSLNITDITNGVSISGSTNPFNTYIKTENAGIYNIQFSAQVDKTDSGTDEIWIWLRKNGTDISDSATSIQLVGNGAHYVAAWNFFVNSAANDYYQLMWYSPDANVRLHAEAGFGVVPGIPSLIVTANRIDQFLSNTGSFSGSFTGQFTGSLFGTSSWALNASTASYVQTAQTASYVLQAVSASFASTVPSTGIIGDITRIATGSVTASVTPTGFTVVSGSMTEFSVIGTGVTIGSAVTDIHQVTGSLNITGSLNVTGSATFNTVASGASSIGVSMTPTNTTTANSQIHYGLKVAQTLTNSGNFTNQSRALDVSIGTANLIFGDFNSPNAYSNTNIEPSLFINRTSSSGWSNLYFSNTFQTGFSAGLRFNTTGELRLGTFFSGGWTNIYNNTTEVARFTGGNLLLQNGGTFTDNGYRLQITSGISGSLWASGSVVITGSISNAALNVNSATNNVQIGTSTDAGFKLDVNGTTRITGATTITGSTAIVGNTLMNVTSATPTVTNGALRILHTAATSGSGTGGVLALGGNAAQLNQNFAVLAGRREDGTSDRGYFSIFTNGSGQSGAQFIERIRINSDGATFFNQSKDNQVQVVPVTINATQGQTGNLLNFVSSSGTVYSAFDATGSLVLGNSTFAGFRLDVSGSTRITGNTLLGTTLLSRIGIGTTTPTASLHVLGTISGSGPAAGQEVLRGVWLQPILHPSSSTGTVYGLDVNPTFDRVFPGDAIGSYTQYGARIFVSASMTSSGDVVGILTLEGTITDNNAGSNSINRFLSITPTLNKVLGSPAIATYNTNIYSAPTIQTGSGAGTIDAYWRDIVSAPTIRGVRNIQQVMCFSATPTVIPVINQNGLWGYYYSGSGGTANNHTAYENVNGNNALNTLSGSTFIGYPTLNNTTTFKLDVLGNTRLSGSLNVSSSITVTGSLLMPTGSRVGTATLVGGNTLVANTTVTANSLIYLTTQTVGGTPGALYVGSKSAGVSFAVSSSVIADTSTFAYFIIN
jgi:hypothetical protein